MSKGRILAVDDEEDILTLLKYNLEREGYLVDCVETGEEAMEHVAAVRPDAILLDLSGYEKCAHHHADGQKRGVGHGFRSGGRRR